MTHQLATPERPIGSLNISNSYVDGRAILSGAFIAAALSFVLLTFGTGLGLSLSTSFGGTGNSLTFYIIAIGLWLVWVQASSCMAGAYIAGRLRQRLNDSTEHEVQVRDGAHGLVVWAIATLVGGLIAASAIFSTIGAGASVAKTAATTIVSGVGKGITVPAVDPDKMMQNSLDRSFDLMFRPAASPINQPPGAAPTITPAAERVELRNEVLRLLASSGQTGTIVESDKVYLGRVVARSTGLSAEEAGQRVDAFVTARSDALAAAQKVVERARKFGIILTFITAVSLLVAAAAAWWAATIGGAHRDEENVLPFLTWRK